MARQEKGGIEEEKQRRIAWLCPTHLLGHLAEDPFQIQIYRVATICGVTPIRHIIHQDNLE